MLSHCALAAAITLGWQWPVFTTPMPVVKSRRDWPQVVWT